MLSAADKKSLEEIFRLFRELETSSRDAAFDPASLSLLKEKIAALSLSSDNSVQRLALTENHLTPSMTLKHFVTFMVPFERLLQRQLQDDDFLVLEKDKDHKPTTALPLLFILDNIRSAFNVGSCLRTAECLHIEKIYLCGYTPLPEQSKVAKTAMGTENFIPWEFAPKTLDLLLELKKKNYHLVALETARNAVDLYADFPQGPTAFVVGNERFGLDVETFGRQAI